MQKPISGGGSGISDCFGQETDYTAGDYVGTENVLYISISVCTGQAQTVHLQSVRFIICNLYLNTINFLNFKKFVFYAQL